MRNEKAMWVGVVLAVALVSFLTYANTNTLLSPRQAGADAAAGTTILEALLAQATPSGPVNPIVPDNRCKVSDSFPSDGIYCRIGYNGEGLGDGYDIGGYCTCTKAGSPDIIVPGYKEQPSGNIKCLTKIGDTELVPEGYTCSKDTFKEVKDEDACKKQAKECLKKFVQNSNYCVNSGATNQCDPGKSCKLKDISPSSTSPDLIVPGGKIKTCKLLIKKQDIVCGCL